LTHGGRGVDLLKTAVGYKRAGNSTTRGDRGSMSLDGAHEGARAARLLLEAKRVPARVYFVAVGAALAALLIFALGGADLGASAAADGSADSASIPFSHRHHADEVGVPCLFCHSGAMRSSEAGIPTLQKCMACHEAVSGQDAEARAEIDRVKAAFEAGRPVDWPDVYRQPDYVIFAHWPHLRAGVACETCHGDVKAMDLVEAQVDMNMGFCLECHSAQGGAEAARLVDCVVCHK